MQRNEETMAKEVTELRDLSAEQIVEAANGILASKLSIDDPASAAARIAKLAGLDAGDAKEIMALARQAAESDPALLGDLLASALNDMAESEPASREMIVDAVRTAGEKQTVVGLDILALGFLVLCGYVVVKTEGVDKEAKTVKVTKQKDGRIEITIKYTKKNLDPLSAAGKLLGKIWPKLGG
jgi:hypothetical protein